MMRSARERWGLPPAVWLAAGATVVLHLATNGNYGMFRDEYYYLACADHLAWGYVDHPPLSIGVLALCRAVFGDSVEAIRLLPALLGGVLVAGGGWLAREIGGGRFAQTLAAVACAILPNFLGMFGFYSMNSIDVVLWLVAFALVARIAGGGDPRLWLAFGAVAGLGLLNKYSMAFLCLGLVPAVLLTPLRRHLRSRWLWAGAALALAIVLPHLLWEVRHGWPTLEFMDNARSYKIVALAPLDFLGAVVLDSHPFNAPLWLGGAVLLLVWRPLRSYRALGWIFVTVLTLLMASHGKPYYVGAALTAPLAAGAVGLERLAARRAGRWLRPAVLALLVAGGLAAAPFAVPALPVETLVAYQRALGLQPQAKETQELGALPQFFADRFGWREMTREVAAVYFALPPEQRARCAIVTRNYGEAGALRYHGRHVGLPPAVSQHNSFYTWGPGEGPIEVLIAVGIAREDLADSLEEVEEAGRVESTWAMPFETDLPIYVARGWKVPLEEAWRGGRLYI